MMAAPRADRSTVAVAALSEFPAGAACSAIFASPKSRRRSVFAVEERRVKMHRMASSPGRRRSRFDTTHWSVVLSAGGERSSLADSALTTLCETYWYPLYAYVRRQGYDADEAKDLTQAFFLRFLENKDVRTVRRERGRFRSWLLASIRHFLLNQSKHQRTLKRGGGQVALSLDFERAEGQFRHEPHDLATPDRMFDRRWALTLLNHILRQLQREWEDAGKGGTFQTLKACLTGDTPHGGYAELGQGLGVTEGAVKVAVHRLRRQFRRLLQEEIAKTVLTDAEVDEEMQHLFRALRR
jgi:RNA polymerase sigma factor (sigma-70 family)